MMRGLQLLEQGVKIVENENGSFAVPSLTRNISYEVTLLQETWVCTCPDFEFREVEFCKHIHATKTWIASKHVKEEPKPKIFADDTIQCDKCGSIRSTNMVNMEINRYSSVKIGLTNLEIHY